MDNKNKFTIKETGNLLKEKNLDRLIIIGIKESIENYEFNITTYGKNKKFCSKTKAWIDDLGKTIIYFINREYEKENNENKK